MADVAQLVEQPIRNRQVSGSSPLVGSITYTVRIPSDISSSSACQRNIENGQWVARIIADRAGVFHVSDTDPEGF